MAGNNGISVSFSNTPQAKDDFFTAAWDGLTEDNLRSHAPLVLDVMANDADGKNKRPNDDENNYLGANGDQHHEGADSDDGANHSSHGVTIKKADDDADGKSKSLYSIDDGINSTGARGDLLQRDAVGATNHSSHGATIKITADGKVSYDASTLDASFVAGLQHLAAGEIATDSFTYAIQLGNGTLSWATATVQIAGVNDAPVVSEPVTGSAIEDGPVVTLDALAKASDVDHGAVLSVTDVQSQLPAGVTYNAATHSFTLDPTDAAFQHLALNQQTTVSVNYGVSDGLATTPASVSWTVTGANDAPAVTGAVNGNATEDGLAVVLNALANASDVDDGAVLQVANVPASLPAGVTYNAAVHTFSLDPTNAAYQSLALNQQMTVTVNYGVSDGLATTPASASWTVTGSNDAPTLQAPVQTGQVFDNTSLTLSATMAFDDVDLLDMHTVTFAALTSGSIGTFTPTISTDSTNSGHGVIGLNYHLTRDQVEAVGGQFPDHQDYLVTIDDHHGGTRSQVLSIPLAQILSEVGGGGGGGGGGGTNHDPVIYLDPAAHDTATGTVFDDVNHPARQHIFSRLSFSDAESQQFHSVSVGTELPGPLGTLGTVFASVLRDTDGSVPNPGDPDGFLAASATGGVLSWQYQVDEQKIQLLGQGETYTDHFQLILMDGNGGSATQHLTVTIVGNNDAPVLQGDGETSLYFNGSFSDSPNSLAPVGLQEVNGFGFIDPDRTDHHTVSAVLDLAHSTVNVPATLSVQLTDDTYQFGPGDINGQVHWVYQLGDSATPYIPGHEGQQREQTWDITIDDGHGGTTIPFVVTFNSAPQIYAIPYPGNPNIIDNGSSTTVHGPTNAWGFEDNLTFTDADPGDHHEVTFAFNQQLSNVAAPVGTFEAHWLNDTGPNGQGGLLHYQYSQSDVTPLPDQPIHEAFDIFVNDNHGGVNHHTIDIFLV